MKRIVKGDTVKITAGARKGEITEVTRVDGDKVYLKCVREIERHYRATQFNQGGKRDIQLPVNISNVALVVDKDKTTKVAYLTKDDKKVRVAKLNNKEVK